MRHDPERLCGDPAGAGRHAAQQEQIERVSVRIGATIEAFFNERLYQSFCADDLRCYVEQRVHGSAPGSADRIMRALRQKGRINYELVSRSRSLYRAIPVRAHSPEQPTLWGDAA